MLSPGTGGSSLTAPTAQGVNGGFQFLFNGSLQALQQAEAQAAAGTVLPPAGDNLPDASAPESGLLPEEAVPDWMESQPPVKESAGEFPVGSEQGEAITGTAEAGIEQRERSLAQTAAPQIVEPQTSESRIAEPQISGPQTSEPQTSEPQTAGSREGDVEVGASAEAQLSAKVMAPDSENTDTEVLNVADGSSGSQADLSGENRKAAQMPESTGQPVPPPVTQQTQPGDQQAQQQQRQATPVPVDGASSPAEQGVTSEVASQVPPEESLSAGADRSASSEIARWQAGDQRRDGSVQASAQAEIPPVAAQPPQRPESAEPGVESLPEHSLTAQSLSAGRRTDDAAAGRQSPSEDRAQAAPAPVSRALSSEEEQERTQPQPVGAGLRTGPDLAASRTQTEMNAGRGDLAVQNSGSQGQSMGGGDEGESPSQRHESMQAQAAAGSRQGSGTGAASPPPFSLAQQALMSPNWGRGMGERAIMMAQHGPRVAHIQLDPPELGAMQIRIHMHGGDQVSVSFSSPNPMVREALEQQMPRLRDMFADQGLNLQDLSVTDQSSGQQSGRHEQAGQEQGGDHYGSGAPAPVDNNALALNAVPVGLVDYYA